MFSVAEKNNILLRLAPEQRKKVKRLAKAAGLSVNEYLATLIDVHFESGSGTLAQLEQMQQDLVRPQALPKVAAKR